MKKVLVALGIIMFIIVLIITAVPMLYKQEIKDAVLNLANKEINGNIALADFDVSLIPNFPNLTAELSGVNVQTNASIDNTIFSMKNFWLTVDLFALVNGEFVINSVGADEVSVNLVIDANGIANYEVLMSASPDEDSKKEIEEIAPSAEGEENNVKLAIDHYSFTHINVVYEDKKAGMKTEIHNLNHTGSGNFDAENFILKTKTAIEGISYFQDDMYYLKDAQLDNSLSLNVDLAHTKIQIEECDLSLNALSLDFKGWVAMPNDSITMDLELNSHNNSFKELFSLIPNAFISDYDDVDVTGNMGVSLIAKGLYIEENYPAFTLIATVKNGKVHYPELPASAENIGIDLRVDHAQGGLNKTVVDLKKMRLEVAQNTFGATLYMDNPMVNPKVEARLDCNFDLASIPTFMPTADNEKYHGIIEANTQLAFDMATLEGGDYGNVDAEGTVVLKNINVVQGALKTHINNARLDFTQNQMIIPNCNVMVGKSDFDFKGEVSNFIPYYLNGEVLTGNLSLNSNTVNADELMQMMYAEEEEKADSATVTTNLENESSSEISTTPISKGHEPLIPANMEIMMVTSINKLVYDSVDYKEIHGKCEVTQGTFVIHNAGLNMFEGTANMTGLIDAVNTKELFDFNVHIAFKDWDIAQIANNYNTVAKLAPVFKGTTGSIYGSVHALGSVDYDYNPNYDALSFNGKLGTKDILISTSTLKKLNNVFKSSDFDPLKINKADIRFHCKHGVLETDPFNIYIAGQKATVSGYTTLDEEINYVVKTKINTTNLGSDGNPLMEQINGLFSSNGVNAMVPSELPVAIQITGSIYDPKISPKFETDNLKQTVTDEIKKQVEDKIEEVKEDLKKDAQAEAKKILDQAKAQQQQLLSEARQQGNYLRQEAEKAAKDLENEAKTQAANLEKEATNPLTKIAAQKAGQELVKQAQKQGAKIKTEADVQAKNIVKEAQKRSDVIIRNAEQRAKDVIEGV